MGQPIGDLVIDKEDLDDEERLVLVRVQDAVSNKISNCLDVYDSSNSLKYRIGYRTGLVEVNGVTKHGDTLITTTMNDRKRISDCGTRAFPKAESKGGE